MDSDVNQQQQFPSVLLWETEISLLNLIIDFMYCGEVKVGLEGSELLVGVGFEKEQNKETKTLSKGNAESFCKSANQRKLTNERGVSSFFQCFVNPSPDQ